LSSMTTGTSSRGMDLMSRLLLVRNLASLAVLAEYPHERTQQQAALSAPLGGLGERAPTSRLAPGLVPEQERQDAHRGAARLPRVLLLCWDSAARLTALPLRTSSASADATRPWSRLKSQHRFRVPNRVPN
jgi:hypothetical protein